MAAMYPPDGFAILGCVEQEANRCDRGSSRAPQGV
jgi:hypothetical protein